MTRDNMEFKVAPEAVRYVLSQVHLQSRNRPVTSRGKSTTKLEEIRERFDKGIHGPAELYETLRDTIRIATEQEAELTQLRTERDRFRVALVEITRRRDGAAYIANAALTQREGGETCPWVYDEVSMHYFRPCDQSCQVDDAAEDPYCGHCGKPLVITQREGGEDE